MTTWPVLSHYDSDHLARISMPLGGIGTGCIGLGGRGDLRDWEIMNRPAKGFKPPARHTAPFFAIRCQNGNDLPITCALEGPMEDFEVEGHMGSPIHNGGLPRFSECSFDAAYPLGQVHLSDPKLPVQVTLQAFNPLIPGDADRSGIPTAILRYTIKNRSNKTINTSICGTLPNFIGMDGSKQSSSFSGDLVPIGAQKNCNHYRKENCLQGIYMDSQSDLKSDPAYGTIAFVTTAKRDVSIRTDWLKDSRWGESLLDFWEDFSDDGMLDIREGEKSDLPIASIACSFKLKAKEEKAVTFIIAWHFPNRQTWTPQDCSSGDCGCSNTIGNYYCHSFTDAWDVALYVAKHIKTLEKDTLAFVHAIGDSDLPHSIQEAALFNLAVLRSQTCFRTPDGNFYGYEGSCDTRGCCIGSCTHVWNYEYALAFLFGDLSRSMREVEFAHATDESGCMSFRVNLPLRKAKHFGKAAADGQMGCIMKLYRDWQLSGDQDMLKRLWPHAKKTLEFCWLPGSWDANQDGVMEGCQHNTMDVEYYGPNPQMGVWYLGALRAAEEMAMVLKEPIFAKKCHSLFQLGSKWIQDNLFNGEYYKHIVVPIGANEDILPSLSVGMGSESRQEPDYQLGDGCLVDQLVGQVMAHVCGLGYLLKETHVKRTLQSIYKYNRKEDFQKHFNNMRNYAVKDEKALLMASYPYGRPKQPFPYFNEVMTGFEYTAAIGMLQEGLAKKGVECIDNIRHRYEGRRRNPFDEAECGHYYARAMASWGAIIAISKFHYSSPNQKIQFTSKPGTYFWSTGYAWGNCKINKKGKKLQVTLKLIHGKLSFNQLVLDGHGRQTVASGCHLSLNKNTFLATI